MIYLDNAATSKPHSDVIETYHSLLQNYFINKEGLYNAALELENTYESSKEMLLSLMSIKSYQCVYTSGASECNNMIVKGLAFKKMGHVIEIITTRIEHPSILTTVAFLEEKGLANVNYVDVSVDGSLDLMQLNSFLTKETALCLFSSVNSEIGFHFNLNDVVGIIRQNAVNCHIHLDAVQGFAKVDTDYSMFDSISISAHKINGLKGSGALLIKKSINIVPLIHGGSQEMGMRGGTVDACHHLLFAKTARLALESQKEHQAHIEMINTYVRNELIKLNGVVINTPTASVSPYIINFSMIGYAPEVVVHALEKYDVLIATKSACSSKKAVSHVLDALDLPANVKESALRVSFTYSTSLQEVQSFIKALTCVSRELHKKE